MTNNIDLAVRSDLLREALDACLRVAKVADKMVPVLRTVHVHAEGSTLTVTATDRRYLLHRATLPMGDAMPEGESRAGLFTVEEVKSLLASLPRRSDTAVVTLTADGGMSMGMPGVRVLPTGDAGEYPRVDFTLNSARERGSSLAGGVALSPHALNVMSDVAKACKLRKGVELRFTGDGKPMLAEWGGVVEHALAVMPMRSEAVWGWTAEAGSAECSTRVA